MRVRKLPDEFVKKGFTYKLIERNDHICVYSQEFEGKIEAYEVFRRIFGKPHPRAADQCRDFDLVEKYPSPEEFGRRAWTYPSLERVLKKFAILAKGITGNE